VHRSSKQAHGIMFFTGQCDWLWASVIASLVPWVAGAVITHLQVYEHLVKWSALGAGMWVQWVCPMFMWARATKEAQRYETNYRSSMQMALETQSEEAKERVLRTDGVPSIENSSVQNRVFRKGLLS